MSFKLNNETSFNVSLIVSISFFLLIGVILFPNYVHQINPDGVSYLSIAEKYSRLEFTDAINGCWGPLISWLLVPFLLLGLKPLVAFKVLSLIIGVFTLLEANSLLEKLVSSERLKYVTLFLISFLVLSYALTIVSPDLLFVYLGIKIIKLILNLDTLESNYSKGILIGLIGACLYLTKNYGFPFFLIAFSTIVFIQSIHRSNTNFKRRLFKNYVAGLVSFLAISFIWIGLISNKYGYLTFGTAGKYNHSVFGPNSQGHPIYYLGLIPPPNETAVSVWEDFSNLPTKNWQILGSLSNFKFFLKRISKNSLFLFQILIDFGFLSISIVIASILFSIQKGIKYLTSKQALISCYLVILCAGYLLLVLEHRYFWLLNLLLITLGASLLNFSFKKFRLNRATRFILVFSFFISFLYYPLNLLRKGYNSGLNLQRVTKNIQHQGIKGRIASQGNWPVGLYLSYQNNWKYYGEYISKNIDDLHIELNEMDIDYLIVWHSDNQPFIEYNFEEIINDPIEKFSIYKIK